MKKIVLSVAVLMLAAIALPAKAHDRVFVRSAVVVPGSTSFFISRSPARAQFINRQFIGSGFHSPRFISRGFSQPRFISRGFSQPRFINVPSNFSSTRIRRGLFGRVRRIDNFNGGAARVFITR